MAVLDPNSDDKNSDFFVENTAHKPSIDEAKVTDIKEEPPITNSSEPLTDQIIKKNLKDKKIGEDELKNFEKKIQNSTDKQILELEKKLEEKEKEIMTI